MLLINVVFNGSFKLFRAVFFGSLLYHYNSGGSKTGIGDIFKNNFSAVSWRQFCIHMTKNKEAL